MRYGSICSGIEAATAAWHSLGWQPQFFAEIDPFCKAVLAHHYPGVKNYGDFTKISNPEPIELICGGTPCQSFSVAGKRGGMDDARGNLALEFIKLAELTRARWLVWENVPGVLSSNNGRDFGSFLGGLAKFGYGFAYRVLNAQYFGVPQRRRRVFVVGYLGDWRPAAAVLFERHSLSGDLAPSQEARQRSAALTATGVGTCGADDNQAAAGHLIARCKTTGEGKRQDGESCNLIAFTQNQRDEVRLLENVGALSAQPGMKQQAYLMAFSSKDHGADAGEIAPTLRAMGHDKSHANSGGQVAIAFATQQTPKGFTDTCPTLQQPSSSGGGQPHAVMVDSSVRRLTPRECERLQGFPDDHTLIKYRGKPAADGNRYRALGNSMAVPVMRWIGQRIEQVDSLINI